MSFFNIFKESSNTFEGQEPGEIVLKLVRRHPFYMIMKIFFSVIIMVIIAAVAIAFAPFFITYNLFPILLFLLSLVVLVLWAVMFYHFTMYTLDVWIITDKRIIDSKQHGFFSRVISELHHTRIQDTSVRIEGFIQSIFHFGDIQVQTAGAEEKFEFEQVPNPEELKDIIMRSGGKSGGSI